MVLVTTAPEVSLYVWVAYTVFVEYLVACEVDLAVTGQTVVTPTIVLVTTPLLVYEEVEYMVLVVYEIAPVPVGYPVPYPVPVGPAPYEVALAIGYGTLEATDRVGKPDTLDEVIVGKTETVLEVDVAIEDEEDEVEDAPQAPTMDGTASTPLPIATKLVPQLSAWATWRFWLSWSKTTNAALKKESPKTKEDSLAVTPR